MSRQRDPKRDEAFQIYKTNGGNINLNAIAAQLGVGDGTVRGWKAKDKWDNLISSDKLPKEHNKRNAPLKGTERPNKTERSTNIKNVPVLREQPELDKQDDNGLSMKNRIFIGEYLRDFNATRAAMAAGYSKKTAYSIGWELLRKPEIQVAIKKYTESIMSDVGLNAQRILMEYMKIAFADITDFIEFGQEEHIARNKKGEIQKDEDGKPITFKVNYTNFKADAEIDGTLISEVKQSKEGVSVKLYDKTKALEVLVKYIDLLPDKHKRMIEEEKLKISRERLEIDRDKGEGGDSDSGNIDQLTEMIRLSAEAAARSAE